MVDILIVFTNLYKKNTSLKITKFLRTKKIKIILFPKFLFIQIIQEKKKLNESSNICI